ncbi:MAG: DUF1839 family protein, partial [Gemmatimonadota bacterium]
GAALTAGSITLLREHLARRPKSNPFRRYATRFVEDLDWLSQEPLPTFHGYAFATHRQAGASFELAAIYLRWLESHGEEGLEPAAAAFAEIAETAKALQFKTARFVNTKKPFDPAPFLDRMVDAWDRGMAALAARYQS